MWKVKREQDKVKREMNVTLVSVPSSSVKELVINNVIRKLCSSDLDFLCAPILPHPSRMICLTLQCSFAQTGLSSVRNGRVILKFSPTMLSAPHWLIGQLNLREPVFPGSETCLGGSLLHTSIRGKWGSRDRKD